MSAELPLSTSNRWMLNSSILSIITNKSSWGCLTLQASFLIKMISSSLLLSVFNDWNHEWMLFTSLAYAFFNELKDPFITSPPEIILISPMEAFMPSVSCSLSFSSFCWRQYGSIFHTNFCNFPWRTRVSTLSFKCLHSSMWCPWSWWNLQYLFLSFTFNGA